jgi:hypothetical protein
MTITQLIVCIVAGLGAGLGTGLAGLSAAAVVSPMLITFLHMPAYQAIGIALASDVLASGVSAWTYKKNKNIDIRHGVIMLISVLIFTLVGSFVSSLVPNGTMGGFSKVMTLFVGLKFIIRPIMTTKEVQANKSEKQKIQQSILCGVVIGFICLYFFRCHNRTDDKFQSDKQCHHFRKSAHGSIWHQRRYEAADQCKNQNRYQHNHAMADINVFILFISPGTYS